MSIEILEKPLIRTQGGMTVREELPPEWIMQGCLSKFRVNPEYTYWTYGDILYNPGGHAIPDYVAAHEERHMKQQSEIEGGKDAWWKKYLADPRFRLEQEADAYGAEYRYFCKTRPDRNLRARFLHLKAQQLASPLYQVAVSQQQASDMIAILAGQKQLPKGTQPPKLAPVA